MHGAAQEALRIVAELNTGYRTPDEVRALLSELTGRHVDESVTVFPPFYCEFGKNLTLGKDVFINMGCRFQDAGGITIGDGTPHRPRQHADHPEPRDRPGPSGGHAPGARSSSAARSGSAPA